MWRSPARLLPQTVSSVDVLKRQPGVAAVRMKGMRDTRIIVLLCKPGYCAAVR